MTLKLKAGKQLYFKERNETGKISKTKSSYIKRDNKKIWNIQHKHPPYPILIYFLKKKIINAVNLLH